MNFLKEKLDSLEERMLAITLLATFIISVFVFSEFWNKLINIIWVHPIMSKLYGYELFIAIVYGAIIALYYYHKFKFTQYYNWNRVCYFGLLFFIYIKCFRSKEWSYSLIIDKTNFSAWTNLIFLVIILEFLLYLTYKKRKKNIYTQQLEIEKTTGGGDAYQRNGSCESVYKIINTCFFDDQSFAVGITGSWGSGKTTYIKSLKDRFKHSKEDISIIYFEPWKNDNPSLIIKSFFSLLKSNLNPYISNISISIDKYVSFLLDCDVPIKWKLFLNAIHFFSVANKKSPYEQIKGYLSETKHRVVVFVDDIDRLDKNEIKEVLRLIRNTANFPYIQFVVAYDKDYVISTLKDSSIENPSIYLEKFFNLEIALPQYESRIICSELESRLSKDISKIGFTQVDDVIHEMIYKCIEEDKNHTKMFIVTSILTNIRDVIRFKNSFYISIHTIKDLHNENEIEIDDLFYIELLRYRYNDIYMILRNRPTMVLKYEKEGDRYIYDEYYITKIIENSFGVYDQKIITEILNHLFRYDYNRHSLCKRRYFSNYFMLRLDNTMFSEIEFMSLGALDGIELSDKVKEMYEQKDEFEFKYQICEILENVYNIDSYDGHAINRTSDYEYIYGILKSLLKCGEIMNKAFKDEITSAIIPYLERLSFYDGNHLKSMLDLYNYLDLSDYPDYLFTSKFLFNIQDIKNLSFESHANTSNCYDIIIDFLKGIDDVVRMSNAINKFIDTYSKEGSFANKFVIDVPTLCKIKLDYFINYNNKLSDNGFILFGNCIYYTDTDKVHLVNKTLEVMRTEIEEKPESYLSNFIHKGSSDDYTNSLYPETYFLIIFGSYENFDKFLESHKSLPSYKRVFRYWQLYKFNDNRPVIFDKQTNVDDVLANNLENEWDSFMQLKNIIQKYKNSPVSLKGIKNAVNSVNSNIQWEYSFILEKLQREYNN